MLIDDFIQSPADKHGVSSMGSGARLAPALSAYTTQRYFLGPHVTEAAGELAKRDSIERSRDFIFTPARSTWIEWRGRDSWSGVSQRHGLFVFGIHQPDEDADLVTGLTMYVWDEPGQQFPMPAMFVHDFAGDGQILTPYSGSSTSRLARAGVNTEKLGDFLAAACALIATPRMTVERPSDLARLNKNRARRGNRPPYLEYRDVDLHVDVYSQIKGERRYNGQGVPLHHVRTYMRMRFGKLELVKPHWKGDERKGIIAKRTRVRMEGDELGDWSPGAPPPPERLTQGPT